MQQQDLTVSDLSARSGISQSYLSRMVAGKVTNPTIDFVLRIAHALDMTVSELLGEQPGSVEVDERRATFESRLSQLERQVADLRAAIKDSH
jgi:transcriptional regulator with XRE-family HTH domain